MTGKEALLTLCFKHLPTIDDLFLNLDEEDEKLLNIIQKDLEVLNILKSRLIVNHYDGSFTDICLKDHFITEDDEDFDKIKEWLEDEKNN